MTVVERRAADNARLPDDGARHVCCEEIGHSFQSERGSVEALRDFTLTIAPHEFVCVVGPSGCGKSTLLRIMAGLEAPTSGRLWFEGPFRDAGARGGLVVQEHGTFPWMTVVDNVAFGLELQGMPAAERRARAMAYLERVELAAFADHFPHELSVGMRQRLGIGRALVADGALLLMDEPFGSLDAQTRRRMQDELLTLWTTDRRTVLFVTHDIEEAVLLGDRVIVMSGRPGRVLEDIRIPFARPRSLRHHSAESLSIVDHVWELLDSSRRDGSPELRA